jgi:ketol-acid reductoisomerase
MKRSVFVRVVTSKIWLPILAGGVALQSGCDPTVKQTFLTGIQTSLVGFTTALIDAIFTSLINAGTSAASSATSQPTAQAAFDLVKNWLA